MALSWDKEKFGVIWRRGGNWVGFFLFWMISSVVVSLLEHSEQNKELTFEAEKTQEIKGLKQWITILRDENDTIVAGQIDKLLKLIDNPITPKLWAKVDIEQAVFTHNLSKVVVEIISGEFSRIKDDLEKGDKDGRQLATDFFHFFSGDEALSFINESLTLHAKHMEHKRNEWKEKCLEKKKNGLTCEERWSFGDSLHYTSTIFTATGYGARIAITPAGKFMTILMIMTQLPFFLHCLATSARNINHLLDKFLGLSDNHSDLEDLTGEGGNETNARQRRMVMMKGLLMMTGVLAVHMMIASVYTVLTTGWDFGDVLYFQFVNYASIGFGDLVPEDEFTVAGAIFKNLLIKIPAEILLFAMLIRVLPTIS